MSNAQSPLKKFNELLAQEIERANTYEKSGLLEQAKKQWLDIIEYCRLFAQKTPDLKPALSQMILQKADKLLDRVRTLESKLHGSNSFNEAPSGIDATVGGEDSIEIVDEEIPAVKTQPVPSAPKSSGDKNIITVGDQKINVPDDFPLVEITPKDSFKPASVPPEKVEIDKTRFTVDDGKNGPAKPAPGKPRA